MIKSMTGYGKAEVSAAGKKITVEIRSLNSKQLDLSVKVPGLYRSLEYEIRNSVAKVMQRGKVDVFISFECEAAANSATINSSLFGAYYRQLETIAAEQRISWNEQEIAAALPAILRLPEVVQNENATLSEKEQQAVIEAVGQALDHIEQFRIQEGNTLIRDLLRRVDKIRALKEEVTPYEKARTEQIKTRIRESIEAVGIPVDNNRLEQEMIFYIEKLDITEEKVRLENHCKYFHEVAASEEGVGRKLGFIAQEMGREINTLGSKANDATIQKLVVQMKDELEKIKEQVLNLL